MIAAWHESHNDYMNEWRESDSEWHAYWMHKNTFHAGHQVYNNLNLDDIAFVKEVRWPQSMAPIDWMADGPNRRFVIFLYGLIHAQLSFKLEQHITNFLNFVSGSTYPEPMQMREPISDDPRFRGQIQVRGLAHTDLSQSKCMATASFILHCFKFVANRPWTIIEMNERWIERWKSRIFKLWNFGGTELI